jgi:hypothetical protein
MSVYGEEILRLQAFEQETIKALADAGLVGPPGPCIAELHRDAMGHRQACKDRDDALYELSKLGRRPSAAAVIATTRHSFDVKRCERCAENKNRDPGMGCNFAPERANGACDQ